MGEQLVISTAAPERQSIVIDGTSYQLATPEDLELRQSLWLAKAGKRVQALMEGEHSDAELDELQALLDRMTRTVVLKLPAEVFARLRDTQKLAIAGAFTDAVSLSGDGSRRSGQTSSPDSNGSTEATTTDGSGPQSQPSGGT